jgi:hypothetical protein
MSNYQSLISHLSRFIVNKQGLWLGFVVAVGLILPQQVGATTLTAYQTSLDKYRTAYGDFEVKRGFFNQNQTFAAEESLVTAARQLLLSRVDVWNNYFDYQINQLSVPELDDETLAENHRGTLKNQVEWLNSESREISTITTRSPLLISAIRLNALKDQYASLAYQTNVITVYGRMHFATKRLIDFNQALKERVESQNLNESEKQTKLRGLSVARERLSTLQTTIDEEKAEQLNRLAYSGSEVYSQLIESTQGLFGELSQINGIHEELADGVLW